MSSVSGLSPHHRAAARRIIAHGCELLLNHQTAVHYTEKSLRWSAIQRQLLAQRGQILTEGDCSSTATWLLWCALYHEYGVRDVVNDESWRGGFTGTMLKHGKRVIHEANAQVGDLAIYGEPGTNGEHVAVCLGGGIVFSHGSEAGPFRLPLHYRPDLMEIRRYI
jgi:hypothetical protein